MLRTIWFFQVFSFCLIITDFYFYLNYFVLLKSHRVFTTSIIRSMEHEIPWDAVSTGIYIYIFVYIESFQQLLTHTDVRRTRIYIVSPSTVQERIFYHTDNKTCTLNLHEQRKPLYEGSVFSRVYLRTCSSVWLLLVRGRNDQPCRLEAGMQNWK